MGVPPTPQSKRVKGFALNNPKYQYIHIYTYLHMSIYISTYRLSTREAGGGYFAYRQAQLLNAQAVPAAQVVPACLRLRDCSFPQFQ